MQDSSSKFSNSFPGNHAAGCACHMCSAAIYSMYMVLYVHIAYSYMHSVESHLAFKYVKFLCFDHTYCIVVSGIGSTVALIVLATTGVLSTILCCCLW